MLGRKQSSQHEDFVEAMQTIERWVSRADLDRLVDQTVTEIRRHCTGTSAAFAWSGGKDSIALEHVAQLAGIHECVLVMSELEYPDFLRWTTNNMPARLEVVSTGQDLDWLAAHPEMLFPRTSAIAGRWFKQVQHTGQERYYRRRGLDGLLVGRRKADGNFVGENGIYTSHGITRYSPIRDWRHEDVLALCHYYAKPMPPCYGWPRGYRVGTGPWPARQWCPTERAGWAEVYAIDPSIVQGAASRFPGARACLENRRR